MEKPMSLMKAVRAKCLDCCGGNKSVIPVCGISNCPLYPFRLGKNPNRTRNMTDEQRQAASERMKKAWEKRRKNKEEENKE